MEERMGSTLFRLFWDGIREDFGYPARVRRLAEESPEMFVPVGEPPRVVKADQVVQWHRWTWRQSVPFHSERGILQVWSKGDFGYGIREIQIPELAHLTEEHVIADWSCDIQDIEGLSASKSKLEDFATLDDMVIANSQKMINEISQAKLEENLAHGEIRILRATNKSDHFEHYAWDGRVFLINSGGSHHLAAARHIAAKLNHPVPLSGELRAYQVSVSAVDGLCKKFDMFAITMTARQHNAFMDGIKGCQATVGFYPMPAPYNDGAGIYSSNCHVIFLPKNNARSMRVSTIMRNAGAYDLGQLLLETVRKQRPITEC